MWEQQLQSMLEADHLDQEACHDLAVTYTAEMHDDALFETAVISFLQQLPMRSCRPITVSESHCSERVAKCYSTSCRLGSPFPEMVRSVSCGRRGYIGSSLSRETNYSFSCKRPPSGVVIVNSFAISRIPPILAVWRNDISFL